MKLEHIYKEAAKENMPTLLLLHGTGGNEKDLLPLADMIAPDASVLGVRGNVLENGMPRFFRRLSEGVFDEEDLIYRTNELNEFLDEASKKYKFDRQNIIAIGYSNGANIAASLLYHHASSLRGAALFHAMVPRRGVDIPNLEDLSIFVGAGKADPLIPAEETKELINHLRDAGAHVTEHWGEGGHQLTRDEVIDAKSWFEEKIIK
ncbi:alpha/beta hydrolase [Alkalihalophilus marmarensis]|jgi:phospholipase/carboxylesterase|uniref:Carboxylesterase n=1 Tax=Alkalihalophilus marmarensis DSM 21297 TaxID=1188261 RepID=U6SPV4_9BACI|nr:alpha/beta hydrolase [Alkalihalophilus marmarensis]ERN52920.1 carboxylesterase [Alkalihalophilus marmarensis DSM 21297]MCM3489172.1 alpha/beta hydrolase [Alkalihalophilus marmarensis]MED1601031.1 alpha/beta hydrolase [Alkalihalophilus marmarensis]